LQATTGPDSRAMIAFLPRERWAKHIPKQLTKRTPFTIASHDALHLECG